MIYQEHESTFANEMLKYLDHVCVKQNNFGTIQLSNDIAAAGQCIEIECGQQEKRVIRKKLFQVESRREK